MQVLWRGTWTTRLRVASGLVLFVYAFFHFLNIGLGLVSHDLMEEAQDIRKIVTRSIPFSVLLYGSLILHGGLALWTLATSRTLRMRPATLVQVGLGLLIPIVLLPHLIFTRYANEVYFVRDEMGFLTYLLWDTRDGWLQAALLLAVWIHGCIGLHHWLRLTHWWRQYLPALIACATLVPTFALAGFITDGRYMKRAFQDEAQRDTFFDAFNWPTPEIFSALVEMRYQPVYVFLGLVALTFLLHGLGRVVARRTSVHVTYTGGPDIHAPKGLTLLQMSELRGVPHTSLCGGKGRCTTCRVIVEDGSDALHPPNAAEEKALRAVKAPPNARLACMIQPTEPLTVFRVFRPDGRRGRDHASQGQERRLAILFLDMRGFTSRTTGQLPYDVVFLLNRFFDAIVPEITAAGGTVDKYLGDGLLAVFETADEQSSARSALRAAIGIGSALDTFNRVLASEDDPPVRIGVGLHMGDVVLGEIGAAGHAPRTIIGDSVNTASRLEGCTKDMGVELIISKPLLETAGVDTSPFELRPLDLRGVKEPVWSLAVEQSKELAGILRHVGADWLGRTG